MGADTGQTFYLEKVQGSLLEQLKSQLRSQAWSMTLAWMMLAVCSQALPLAQLLPHSVTSQQGVHGALHLLPSQHHPQPVDHGNKIPCPLLTFSRACLFRY